MSKISSEDIKIPNTCDECNFIGRYEKGQFARNPHCCCELIWELKEEDYRVNKNSLDENCPLKFIKEKSIMNNNGVTKTDIYNTIVETFFSDDDSSSLEVTTKLPTKEEFKATIKSEPKPEYSEPKYECEKCGGGMCKNNRIVLTSYPPKYLYKCNKCGHVDYMGR